MTELFFTHLPLPDAITEHRFRVWQKVRFNTKDTIQNGKDCVVEGIIISVSTKRDYTGKIKVTVEDYDKNEYQIFPGVLSLIN